MEAKQRETSLYYLAMILALYKLVRGFSWKIMEDDMIINFFILCGNL